MIIAGCTRRAGTIQITEEVREIAHIRDAECEGIGRADDIDGAAGRFGEGADGVAGAVEDLELPGEVHGKWEK